MKPIWIYCLAVLAGLAIVPLLALVQSRASPPKMDLVTRIARVHGWTIEDAKLEEKVRNDALAGTEPSDEDWQRVVQLAGHYNKNRDWIVCLVGLASHLKNPKYQPVLQRWCIGLMGVPQSESAEYSLYGLMCYVLSNANEASKRDWEARVRPKLGSEQLDKLNNFESKIGWKPK